MTGPHAPPSGSQPGDRDPAPGDLALVQSFLNSRWDLAQEQEEQLRRPADLSRWLGERDLLKPGTRLREADLTRALDVREGLRALLFANNGAPLDRGASERLDQALGDICLGVDLRSPDALGLRPRGRGFDAALASIAAIVTVAQIDGSWSRLKACRGVHCGWAFYDHSRNQSGSWCSMSVCGSRAKAREYRRRKRTPARA